MQKYKVKLNRKKGWPVYGYFEVENAEKIAEIIALINTYCQNDSETDEFSIVGNEDVSDNPKKWIKKKRIRSFSDWKRRKRKLMNYSHELNNILLLVSLGFSMISVSLLLLFFKKEVANVLFSKISLFEMTNIALIICGVAIILEGLKSINDLSGTNLFFLFAAPGFLLPALFIMSESYMNVSIIRWLPVYFILTSLMWFTIVASARLLGQGYQLFQSTIKDQKTRMEILLTVFGVIISLIALFK